MPATTPPNEFRCLEGFLTAAISSVRIAAFAEVR